VYVVIKQQFQLHHVLGSHGLSWLLACKAWLPFKDNTAGFARPCILLSVLVR
jgi:hypothetical protein